MRFADINATRLKQRARISILVQFDSYRGHVSELVDYHVRRSRAAGRDVSR